MSIARLLQPTAVVLERRMLGKYSYCIKYRALTLVI